MNRLHKCARLPATVVAWYADRIGRLQRRQVAGWAAAEIVCMSLSLAALVMLAGTIIARAFGFRAPAWLAGYILPVLLAGAVGYLTNLIAVTMLFRPFGPEDDHPVGAIPGWPQGLIPRNKAELAEHAGRQVAQHLLTPEVIADETRLLIDKALADPELQTRLRTGLGPIIRQKLPELVSDQLPELMRVLREMVAAGFTRENFDRLFEQVIDPWLSSGRNKEMLASELASLLRSQVPR
jgi:uncharacterized membrane-anchored protein YjiN (DUF445 family)